MTFAPKCEAVSELAPWMPRDRPDDAELVVRLDELRTLNDRLIIELDANQREYEALNQRRKEVVVEYDRLVIRAFGVEEEGAAT